MGYQIDYISVKDGKSCGDAIGIRYTDSESPWGQKIAVIDGGTIELGDQLVDHIITHYGTNKVDHLFSTHLDMDHLSGVRTVLQKLEVDNLYIHLPWEHAKETTDLYKRSYDPELLKTKLQKSLEQVHEVQEIAIEKGTSIEEVFAGDIVGNNFIILGPSKEYYETLTAEFRDTPPQKSALEQVFEIVKRKTEEFIVDKVDIDILGDGGTTSAENNSSLIILFLVDNHKLLFTGDAGIPALTYAADFANNMRISLDDLKFFHVPHHGSRQNLGSTILKRIKAESAIVSASANCSDTHPSKVITNALHKSTTEVNTTEHQGLLYHHNSPRPGWVFIDPLPFYHQFSE